ncbi:NADPH-cytochrome P450 reductase [Lipomyces kononenkoae]|uniref:NADPH-cytochrome P450 reductase n=1 Tax=Lipomyces kononenkoae TaxID=34357 RepID=A0ACC3SXV1_LIPKO
MANLDPIDTIVYLILLTVSFIYLAKFTFATPEKSAYESLRDDPTSTINYGVNDFVESLRTSGKTFVIFYGSQTGTAEGFANALSKEGSQRFGLKTAVVDLSDFNISCLRNFPEGIFATFIMATYGEGEPTDNAVAFYQSVMEMAESASDEKPLDALRYACFGLGNRAYEHYNATMYGIDAALQILGARRIGEAGEGDDAGSIEDDFLSWKESMWSDLSKELSLQETEMMYQPLFSVEELASSNNTEPPDEGAINAQSTNLIRITKSHELFNSHHRNCLHVEFDLGGTGMNYETGDHLAIWPIDLSVFGLKDKLSISININAVDQTAPKVQFPCHTTYDAVIRFYLEICAPVSRQLILSLAPFAPDEDSKAAAIGLGNSRQLFHTRFTSNYYNIAQALQSLTPLPWANVPFSLLLESIPRLQPRYYSISSSYFLQPKQPSITCVVESVSCGDGGSFKGLNTNHLLWLTSKIGGPASTNNNDLLEYPITKVRNNADSNCTVPIYVPAYIRHSKFRLPKTSKQPIIMVGPGTGVAPFRAFIQERDVAAPI